jgi:hypothetical protein
MNLVQVDAEVIRVGNVSVIYEGARMLASQDFRFSHFTSYMNQINFH